MNILRFACKINFIKNIIKNIYSPKDNPVKFLNIQFKNLVGLGAGFDKNAAYLNALQSLGFSFIEIGTVTPLPQDGNEKPRLFRLKKDEALINRMGFNNAGVDVVVSNLKIFDSQKNGLIIGGNIGKNKNTTNENALDDYLICFKKLYEFVDYFVVNVSSPNTPGLRDLQNSIFLTSLFNSLDSYRKTKEIKKPILLKIAPDLEIDNLLDLINACEKLPMDGWVTSNTTISRQNLKTESEIINKIANGGLSGKPLFEKSNDILNLLSLNTNKPIIASGGIFNANDANTKLKLGAQLIQIWTGFIYEGPSIVKNISNKLN